MAFTPGVYILVLHILFQSAFLRILGKLLLCEKELVLEELSIWIPKKIDQDLVAAVMEKVKLNDDAECEGYDDMRSDVSYDEVEDWEYSDESDSSDDTDCSSCQGEGETE